MSGESQEDKKRLARMMLDFIEDLRSGKADDAFMKINMIGYLVEEREIITYAELTALENKPGQPPVSADLLLEMRKNEYDRLALKQKMQIERGNNLSLLPELKLLNARGHRVVKPLEIEKMESEVYPYEIKTATFKLEELDDRRAWGTPSEKNNLVVRLIDYIDTHEIPDGEIGKTKAEIMLKYFTKMKKID